jgi:signal transduction histidine kinase
VSTRSPEHFDIDASVVFQLGESLVTDVLQALLELIKNSYDADASFCSVEILSSDVPDLPTEFPNSKGYLVIQDDGVGMDLSDIRRGWLTISNSAKRELKAHGKTTLGGRTPLGDKGLGRLGTQRLGDNIELITCQERSSQEHHISFSWRRFLGQKSLSDVDITHAVRPKTRSHGTTLVISDLRDIRAWEQRGAEILEEGLSRLLSPYTGVPGFEVYTRLNSRPVHTFEVTEKLRTASLVRYGLKYDDQFFKVGGRSRLSFFLPEKGKRERDLFAELVEKDDGKEFYGFLSNLKGAEQYNIKKAKDPSWFLEFGRGFALDEDKVTLFDDKPADPGSFFGEVDFFSLGKEAATAQKVFAESEYRRVVKVLSGIRVYRDGFGVRLAQDWLHLGSQWTGGASYYGLKPQNTLGFIQISAHGNQNLVEKTDREGFIENAYYLNFERLLRRFTKFSEEAQDFLRRGWTSYKKLKLHVDADVRPATTPEELVAEIGAAIGQAASLRSSVSMSAKRLQSTIDKADRCPNETNLAALIEEIRAARDLILDLDRYLSGLQRFETVAKVVKEQVESLREQVSQLYEVVSLGLTAEALSHEIENISEQLAHRNDQLTKYLSSRGPRDPKIIEFTNHVKTAIAGLRKELTYLSPSLRYVRERREDIDVAALINDIYRHHLQRLSNSAISISINRRPSGEFTIRMNRGKLIQVLDNLLINSEYWLKEDLRAKRIGSARISIEIDKPFIRVSDNGRGVDPVLENSIFQPFVTAKEKGRGRGLGLFVVQQLLEVEGCGIRLLPQRNKHDRRYVFELDLRSALSA